MIILQYTDANLKPLLMSYRSYNQWRHHMSGLWRPGVLNSITFLLCIIMACRKIYKRSDALCENVNISIYIFVCIVCKKYNDIILYYYDRVLWRVLT